VATAVCGSAEPAASDEFIVVPRFGT